jgi:hypothetical protein
MSYSAMHAPHSSSSLLALSFSCTAYQPILDIVAPLATTATREETTTLLTQTVYVYFLVVGVLLNLHTSQS